MFCAHDQSLLCFCCFLTWRQAEPARAAPLAVDASHRAFVFEKTLELLKNRRAPTATAKSGNKEEI